MANVYITICNDCKVINNDNDVEQILHVLMMMLLLVVMMIEMKEVENDALQIIIGKEMSLLEMRTKQSMITNM
jgi:hypothetical protein